MRENRPLVDSVTLAHREIDTVAHVEGAPVPVLDVDTERDALLAPEALTLAVVVSESLDEGVSDTLSVPLKLADLVNVGVLAKERCALADGEPLVLDDTDVAKDSVGESDAEPERLARPDVLTVTLGDPEPRALRDDDLEKDDWGVVVDALEGVTEAEGDLDCVPDVEGDFEPDVDRDGDREPAGVRDADGVRDGVPEAELDCDAEVDCECEAI